MPTYSYSCQQCNYKFDLFQKITDNPICMCPHCNTPNAKRLIGGGCGLIFKGSGFYITDYRDSTYQERARAEAGTSCSSKESVSCSKH